MAIEIPHEVALFLNFAGVPYPDINEDQVRELAERVREFADKVRGTHESATGAINDMGAVYSGYSYQQLVAAWGRMSTTHMAELDRACAVVAKALHAAATVITVVKAAVLAELAALAAVYVSSLAAMVATSGLSAALTQAVTLAARKLVGVMEQVLLAYLAAEVLGKAIEPLEQAVENMINRVAYRTVADLLDVSPSSSSVQPLYIEPDEVLRYAGMLDGFADDILGHAADFADKAGRLDFTTPGGAAYLGDPEFARAPAMAGSPGEIAQASADYVPGARPSISPPGIGNPPVVELQYGPITPEGGGYGTLPSASKVVPGIGVESGSPDASTTHRAATTRTTTPGPDELGTPASTSATTDSVAGSPGAGGSPTSASAPNVAPGSTSDNVPDISPRAPVAPGADISARADGSPAADTAPRPVPGAVEGSGPATQSLQDRSGSASLATTSAEHVDGRRLSHAPAVESAPAGPYLAPPPDRSATGGQPPRARAESNAPQRNPLRPVVRTGKTPWRGKRRPASNPWAVPARPTEPQPVTADANRNPGSPWSKPSDVPPARVFVPDATTPAPGGPGGESAPADRVVSPEPMTRRRASRADQ